MVCCLTLLSAIFGLWRKSTPPTRRIGNAHVSQILMEWWKASTMFFGADAFNQPIGAWNMSAVTNMGGCSVELMPQTNRLVPETQMGIEELEVDVVFCSCGPAGHCRSVPGPNGLVEGKHHVLWC